MKKKAASPYENLPEGPFDVVLCDFPWRYTGSPTKWGAAEKEYATMADEDILAFPMKELLAKKAVVFMWATSPRLDFAMRCIEAWGLHYRGVAFVWVKTKKTAPDVPVGAQGVRPSIIKPTCEFVLAVSNVASKRPIKLFDESIRNTILAPVFHGQHSRKPRAAHARIGRMYPAREGYRKLELFAREPAKGWEVWGLEVDKFKKLESVKDQQPAKPKSKNVVPVAPRRASR